MGMVMQLLWEIRYYLLFIGGGLLLANLLARLLGAVGDWLRKGLRKLRYSTGNMGEVERMSGVDFTYYLAHLFHKAGFGVQLVSPSGEVGACLVLTHPGNGERVVVQARQHKDAVGSRAVQEVQMARTAHQCSRAIIVATVDFTPAAVEAARLWGVSLIDRERLTGIIERVYPPTEKRAA